MMLGWEKENWLFILHHGRHHKRHSMISSYWWESKEITIEKCRPGWEWEGYKFLEVDRRTILEICRFWNAYLVGHGIKKPSQVEDVYITRDQ